MGSNEPITSHYGPVATGSNEDITIEVIGSIDSITSAATGSIEAITTKVMRSNDEVITAVLGSIHVAFV